jgi:hypothetical protein
LTGPDLEQRLFCTSARHIIGHLTVLTTPNDWVTENIFELQFPRDILASLASGRFGAIDLESGPLSSDFIKWVLEKHSTAPTYLTGMRTTHLNKETENIRRLMWTLGNKFNDQHFVIASRELNAHKTLVRIRKTVIVEHLLIRDIYQLWAGSSPVDDGDMEDLITAVVDMDTACAVFCQLRQVGA